MKSLVSVIMPVYNSEKYIDEAIQSVLRQNYHNWELLIVDDCSKDNSYSIMKNYEEKDERIHCFQTEQPSGSPAHPRNIAIQHAKGRFIAFLDSDDIWLPNKLSEQVPLFNNPQVAIVYSNYEKISESGIRNNRIVTAPPMTNYNHLLMGCVIGNLTGVYDTQKVGKVYLQKIHHEDYACWLTILKKGYIAVNTQTVAGLYRLRNTSVSANKFQTLQWQWNIYTNIEHINPIKSAFLFLCYAFKAVRKALI